MLSLRKVVSLSAFIFNFCLSLAGASTNISTNLLTYPIPAGVANSTAFDVKVRSLGGQWKTLGVYRPSLTEINTTTGSRIDHSSSMVYFDFNGTVEVSATWVKASPEKVRVRPDSYGITPQVSGNAVLFTLDKPRNVVLQVNGEIFDVLHIFANRLPVEIDQDDPDVIYYGPGFHQVSSTINVPTGKTVYIAGGAVLDAPAIEFNNVTSGAVRGHGVLTTPRSGNILVKRSHNVIIDGPIGLNYLARTYDSSNVTIRNWRSFSSVQWGDGIDIYTSQNILLDSLFLRTSDDCVALYNHRDEWYGDLKNITLKDSSLWADVAHPFNLGTHGNTPNPESATGIAIRNVDILDHREKQVLYQGAIAINAGDSNLIQDVLIDDVRVEDFRLGQLINFRVMYNKKYNTSPGRGIHDVVIRDLAYNGNGAITSLFSGYDDDRTISNVTFYNLKINGKVITDSTPKPGWYLTSDLVPLHVNDHVYNLTFKA